MRTNRPPVNGEVIRAARIAKGMTLEDVQRECAGQGVPVWNLSRMENGRLRWPHPKVIAAVADVLGLNPEEMTRAAA
jgi:transcriptional regulator with XRE-family HTH domain